MSHRERPTEDEEHLLIAVRALKQISENYATCLAPVLIAMDALDQLCIAHRGTPPALAQPRFVGQSAGERTPDQKTKVTTRSGKSDNAGLRN